MESGLPNALSTSIYASSDSAKTMHDSLHAERFRSAYRNQSATHETGPFGIR